MRSEMRVLEKIDEEFSKEPMEGRQWKLKVKWRSMRRAGLEYSVPRISRRRRSRAPVHALAVSPVVSSLRTSTGRVFAS